MCFDDRKVTEAIADIKKIEEQCITQIGWMKSIKNKFISQSDDKSLEQSLEERIVLADSLVCQSFLTFLRNDFTSYMKGGWTLRRAWKIYQHTYDQLLSLNKKYNGKSQLSHNWRLQVSLFWAISVTSIHCMPSLSSYNFWSCFLQFWLRWPTGRLPAEVGITFHI